MKKFILFFLLILSLCTIARAQYVSDVIVTSPNGLWTDSRAYSSLANAITAVGVNQRTIVIASNESVTSLTVPANVTLRFEKDGSITNTGQLTINTKNIEADSHQIFTGTGNIDFASGTILKSSWFSNIESAFALTTNDTVTLLMNKAYTVTASYSPGNNVLLKWEAPGNVLTVSAGKTVGNLKLLEAGDYQIFGGAGDFDFLDGTRLKLSWFTSLHACLTWIETEDVTIVIPPSTTVDHDETTTSNENFDMESEQGSFNNSAGITLTIYSPANIIAGDSQRIYTGDGTISYSVAGKIEVGWEGSDGTAIETTLTSAASGSIINIPPGTYQDVTIAKDDVTINIAEGVIFQTSASGTTPAILFNGCDRLSVNGRIVADGNFSNNPNAFTDSDGDYDTATVAFYNSTYLSIGDIYCYDAYHDGVVLDTTTFSTFGNIISKSSNNRGFTIWKDSTDNFINSVKINGTTKSKGVRIGGSSGHPIARNQINSIQTYNTGNSGVLIEAYNSKLQIGKILVDTASGASGANGVKIEDASDVTIDTVNVYTVDYNGLIINCGAGGVSNISIGKVIVDSATQTTDAGNYAGVIIQASAGGTTKNITIDSIISNNNDDADGYGLFIVNDGSSVIDTVRINSIITKDNGDWGIFVDDAGTVQNIKLGNIISTGNTTGDFRVENGVINCSWGDVTVDVAHGQQNNSAAFKDTGKPVLLEADYTDAATSGTGEDNLKTKSISSAIIGTTGTLHVVACGTVSGTNNNKVIKLYFGTSGFTVISQAAGDTNDWKIEAWISNLTTGTQRIMWEGTEADGTKSFGYETTSIDTTSAVNLKLTGECTNGTDVITQTMWLVERI